MSSQLTQRDSLDTESELSSFSIRANSSVVVLPDRVAASQNGNDVELRTNFAAADCSGVPANWIRCCAVLCASWNSSRCDFRICQSLAALIAAICFWKSGERRWLLIIAPLFLLFAAVVQHARRPGRVRGGEGEPPW